ncbi:MAG: flagellar hook-basal body complex protein FliE [Desulfobacterales bacterium]|nr:flagellar hook-basal body complex protein FliE [Desulfobacterales bacterium]
MGDNVMKISGTNKISLQTEPLANKIQRRDSSFAKRVKEAVEDVNLKQHQADIAIEQVINGELGVHEGMMALGKADTSLRLLTQVRGKVIEAYKEIIRMQV